MTIASTTSKVSYNGSGSVGPFPITFKFTKNADITATKRSSAGVETVLTLTTHYTLTGAGDASGGTLTLVTALAVGESLVIARSPAIVQEVDYVENSAFPAETHEAALDLLTMICQSLQEQIDRAVLVPISSTTSPEDLLDELSGDVVSAASSAATATTQAGLATSAKTAAESARDDASDFADTASAGAGVITANLTAINNITANLTAVQGAAANASTASTKASEASASAASASSSAASAAASAASAAAIVNPSSYARSIGGQAYKNILGIVCPPSLEVMAYDHQGAVNGVPPGFTFTRATTATSFGPDGQLYTAEAGELRHEWDALTGEYKGWLLEGQATNLLHPSSNLTDATWEKSGCTIEANAANDPTGALTACKVTENTANANHMIVITPTVSAAVHAVSYYIKPNGRTKVLLYDPNTLNGGIYTLTGNGSFTSFQGGVGGISGPDANGYYRTWITYTYSGTSSHMMIHLLDAAGNGSYAGDGASGVYVWGAQAELGSYPTSYIPTTSAQVTRAADSLSIATSAFPFSANGGSLACEVMFPYVPASGSQDVFGLSDGTADNCIKFSLVNGHLRAQVTTGAAAQADIDLGAVVANTMYRPAMAWAVNDIAACLNGGTVGTDATATIPTVTTLSFAKGCWTKWGYEAPRRHSNTELQLLTK